MHHPELTIDQCILMRRELEGHQARQFWIIVFGLMGLPLLGYFLPAQDTRIWIVLPFFVLVFINLFLTQQGEMMRAGRHIRELVEERVDSRGSGTNRLQSHTELQPMDRHISACFIVLFFVYYFLSIGLALHRLWLGAAADPLGTYWPYFFGAATVYTITTIWGLAALLHHWHSSTSGAQHASES